MHHAKHCEKVGAMILGCLSLRHCASYVCKVAKKFFEWLAKLPIDLIFKVKKGESAIAPKQL